VTFRRLLAPAAAAAIAAALLVPSRAAEARTPSPAAQRAGASVTVADMAFSPASVTVAVGESVTWTFQDSISHTTTSDQGFWDSGTRSGGATYARAFTSAGTFAYHCSIHSMMHGKVRVPVTATGSPSAGWQLRWATKKGTGAITFVVQTRLGKGRWTALVTGASTPSKSFDPAKAGTYSVRARTAKGSERSGWSPTVTVTIS
jgi:plastocyanin